MNGWYNFGGIQAYQTLNRNQVGNLILTSLIKLPFQILIRHLPTLDIPLDCNFKEPPGL